MQITRQADYALRAVHYLARLSGNAKVSTSEIAEKQEIPLSFLAKIIAQLAVVGLVNTTRGAHGGVSLAKMPEEISLLDVVEAIDGPITLNECVVESHNCTIDNCPMQGVWCEAQDELIKRLGKARFSHFVAVA